MQKFKINLEVYILIALLILVLITVSVYKIDFYLADLIYNYNSGWQWRDSWLTSVLIHKFGKYILIFMYIFLLVDYGFRARHESVKEKKFGKIVLLSSLFLGSACVGYLKQVLNVDCPWDLIRYGGEQSYHTVFNQNTFPHIGHCFPAGHSSAAFTWVSLYFYSSIYFPKIRLKVLAIVLIVGFIFGFSQQLRGAHFFSHDICSLLVCLLANMLVYSIAFRKKSITIMNPIATEIYSTNKTIV